MQHFGHVLLYYSRKVKTLLKCKKKKICAVYGEGAVTDCTCQKRFAKFHAGDSSLDNAPQSSRPVEVHRGQIETLIENNWLHHVGES